MRLERHREWRPARGEIDDQESYSRQIPFGGRRNRWFESYCVAGEVTAIAGSLVTAGTHYYAPGGLDFNRAVFGFGRDLPIPDGRGQVKTTHRTGNPCSLRELDASSVEREMLIKRAGSGVSGGGSQWERSLVICNMRCGS